MFTEINLGNVYIAFKLPPSVVLGTSIILYIHIFIP